MYCRKCGNKLNGKNDGYCPYCGVKLITKNEMTNRKMKPRKIGLKTIVAGIGLLAMVVLIRFLLPHVYIAFNDKLSFSHERYYRGEGLYEVEKDGYVGLEDREGNSVIPCKYLHIDYTEEMIVGYTETIESEIYNVHGEKQLHY